MGRPAHGSHTTAKALDVFEFMKTYQRDNGMLPTRRVMAEHFRTSTSYINYLLFNELVPMGKIKIVDNTARGIVIVDDRRKLVAYVCPMPECEFFTSSHEMTCPDHPKQTLLEKELVESE